MGANYSKSHFQSFDPDRIGEIVATIGPSYVMYRESIVHNAVSGEVLVEITSVEMLTQFLVDIGVSNSVHKLVLTNHFKKIFLSRNLALPSSSDSTSTIANPIKFNSDNIFNIAHGKYHIFLTHDWGVDGKNHDRVAIINSILKTKFNLVTWFDEERMEGDVRNKMTSGIANSICLVVFITERYAGKVSTGGDDKRDNCKFEFEFGLSHLGHHRVITVVLEDKMKNPNDWPKELKAEVGRLLYIDMTSDEETVLLKKCDELSRRVHGITSSLSVEEKAPFIPIIPDKCVPSGEETVDVDTLEKVDSVVDEVATSMKSEGKEDTVPITTEVVDAIYVELIVPNAADAPVSTNSESVVDTKNNSVESILIAQDATESNTLSDTKADNDSIDRVETESLSLIIDEVVPVIIDFGSFATKAGFGGDEKPNFIFPTVVGHPRENFVDMENCFGDEAQSKRGILRLKYPLKDGDISDWDDFERLLHYTIYEELRVCPEEHPFLMVDSGLSESNKERLTQILFENFYIPYFYIYKSAGLALAASVRLTGLVVECGEGCCRCVPVYDGNTLPGGVIVFQFGGQAATECLKSLLLDPRFPYAETIRTLSPLSLSENVREIKERICCVRLGNEEVKEMMYELPDGQRFSLHKERYLCTEPFFELDGGIQRCVVKSIMKCDSDIRRDLWNNIVLSGGSSCFPGFQERFLKEISSLKPVSMPCYVTNDEKSNPLVWQGGSIISRLPPFQSHWISKADYDGSGPSIIHRKCIT